MIVPKQERTDEQHMVDQLAKFAATVFYFLTREFVDEYGEGAKAVAARAMYRLGQFRGAKIGRNVDQQGLPRNLETLMSNYDLPLGKAWESVNDVAPDRYRSTVTYCPFAAAWAEMDRPELGQLYCEVDAGIMNGFNEAVQFCRMTHILDCGQCTFDVQLPPQEGEGRNGR